MRLCQNRRRGRDNLDGQGLWLLLSATFSFILLLAAHLHLKQRHCGHLLPHGQFISNLWMEPQLDGGDTRWDTSLQNFYQHGLQQCQDWSNILNWCKIAKFYDFLHGLFGLSTKGLRNQFYYKSQMALKEDSRILTDADQYQSMRKILFRAKSSLDWNNQQKTGNFSKCFSPTKS